jgi:hypothetical protein
MAAGFTIAEVRFRGENVEDAVIRFAQGLSVVAGPSNTGKSLLRSALNFVFGSSEPMKTVDESVVYGSILVEVRTTTGETMTFERAWQGGDVKQYAVAAQDVTVATRSRLLSSRHSAENETNISAVLLSLAGLTGRKILRSKTRGDVRNLSFRDLVEYVLISEERIITELSPIHSGNPIDKTAESSIFRVLLTGKDDKDVIVSPTRKDEKARFAGQEEALERFRADLTGRLPQDDRTEEDLERAVGAIDARIAEQSRLLQSYRTDTTDLEHQRRELELNFRRAQTRLSQVDANLQRFNLLNQQYDSDLKRLHSTVEAGGLFADYQEGPCPVCGADSQHHKLHALTQQQLDEFIEACRAEAEKIRIRQLDLAQTNIQLATERRELNFQVAEIETSRAETSQALKAILEPSIANINGDLTILVDQRAELGRAIGIFQELHRLDELERQLERAPLSQRNKEKAFSTLPSNTYVDFARTVEELLRSWAYPELDRVVFDTTTEDIVISGKARKDNGKGYRAITYAAFMIGVLLETGRKSLPHPGFVVLDSPLVTYREPEEHIGEGVKIAFYRSLASIIGAQVIVLENEEPPKELMGTIAYTGFTKNRSVGRYGLFPPS